MHRVRVLMLLAALCALCSPGAESALRHVDVAVFVDALGDTVRVPKPPERVVSLAPNLTELVYALGEQDRLVGVTDFCDYPPEAAKKPRVAGFNVINLEAILSVRPELILANRGNSPSDLATLRRMGIPVYAFQVNALAELIAAARTLGALLGCPERGDSLARAWQERMDRVAQVVREVPDDMRPRVFFGGVSEPIYTVGPGSFIHDVIVHAGGRNIFADAGVAWPRVDLETLVRRNPDVLVMGAHEGNDPAEVLARLRAAPGWRSLRAVQTGRVVILGDAIMRPGPRLFDALETLSRALYPDRFPPG